MNAREFIVLKSKTVINLNALMYIKSDGHYLEFYLNNSEKPEIDRNTLSNILTELPSTQFVRIHKSYIINLNYLKIINASKIKLDNDIWINLSRTYKENFKEILQLKLTNNTKQLS